jgi:glycerate 2-kinase
MEKSFRLHLDIAQAALREADPQSLLKTHVSRREDTLSFGAESFSMKGPGLVVALGKAAGRMALGLRDLLTDVPCDWLCVTKDHHFVPPGMSHLFASHPVPDRRSVFAAEELLHRAQLLSTKTDSWFLLLLSGGASALACAPGVGVSLEDKQWLTRLLLSSGLEISDCNVVRCALSRLKGGGLARALGQTRSACLILSDVVRGDPLSVGSGPLAPAPMDGLAKKILQEKNLWERLPLQIKSCIEAQHATQTRACAHIKLGDRSALIRGAMTALRQKGFAPICDNDSFAGSVSELVTSFSLMMSQLEPGQAFLVAGEPTLAVDGPGRGGRAQHTALWMAKEISGVVGVSFLAIGSDGTDGPTDAAGAIVDEHTWRRCLEAGIDPSAALLQFDSYAAHSAAGSLLTTGPTGTNVNDLYLLLRE